MAYFVNKSFEPEMKVKTSGKTLPQELICHLDCASRSWPLAVHISNFHLNFKSTPQPGEEDEGLAQGCPRELGTAQSWTELLPAGSGCVPTRTDMMCVCVCACVCACGRAKWPKCRVQPKTTVTGITPPLWINNIPTKSREHRWVFITCQALRSALSVD